MKSFYSKLLNYKKIDFKLIIICIIFIIFIVLLMHSWTKREGFSSITKDVSLNIILTDTTTYLTDPNPYGIFNIYTYIKKDYANQKLTIPYPTKKGELDVSLPFDASSLITVLKIEPKNTTKDSSKNKDPHKTDMFPKSFKLDITINKDANKYMLSKEKDTSDINNRITPTPSDLSRNEIIIVKNGPILDENSSQIGTAYKGDANPLNPSSKNPYILNIILKNAKDIGRINIEYKMPDKEIDIRPL